MPGSLQEERPIFIQVAEMLEDAILSGAYGEEEQVPSITEISVAYKMNPATALKGVTLLVDAGLLYKRRGMGMFVARGARGKASEKPQGTVLPGLCAHGGPGGETPPNPAGGACHHDGERVSGRWQLK